MSASTLQDQAVAFVRSQFTKLEVDDVKEYGGEFTEAEIRVKSFVCPIIFVAVLGWHPANDGRRQGGRKTDRVYMAAFVVTKSVDREERARSSLRLTERLAEALRGWFPDCTGLDSSISALEERPTCENMYSRALDSENLARWLVKWDQLVTTLPSVLSTNPPVDLTGVDIVDKVRSTVDASTSSGTLDVTDDVQFPSAI